MNNDIFKILTDAFYKYNPITNKWVKTIPADIGEYLNDEMVAFFYMDDGALKDKNRGNAVRFCTECYTLEEVLILQRALKTRCNIEVTLVKHNKGFRLYVP